jgi:23S rRNA (adenine-N6)-dimethyltransferase
VPAGGRWGRHLLDERWAARVVAAAEVRPGELVLDLGAGSGALTAPLVATGARVLAVELHAGRAAALRRRFAGQQVTVVERDLGDLRLPLRPFRVVANPPYGVSTALLRLLLGRQSALTAADVVLPRALVRQLASGDTRGVRPSRRFVLSAGPTVPRHAFAPPPRVDSAVLVVRHR